MTDREETFLEEMTLGNGALGESRLIEDRTTVAAPPQTLTGLFHADERSLSFIGKPITALAKARTRGAVNRVTKDSLTIGNDVTIRLIGGGKKDKDGNLIIQLPGAGEAKLLRYGVSALTKVNSQFEKKPILRIYGDTKDFARACIKDAARGIDPRPMATPEEQERENQRAAKALENFVAKLGKNARLLRNGAQFDFVATSRGKEKRYSGLTMLGAYDIDADVIMLEFTQTAAEYFVQQPLSITPRAYYAIDERKPNALAIADELIRQYGNENNVIRNTEGVLKIETLLHCTSLPTIDELTGKGGKNKAGETVNRTYRYRWIDRIKEPFEEALDELTQKGLIKDWSYCLSGKQPLPDDEPIVRYEQFISLYVRFELCGYEPHADRVKLIEDKRATQREKSAQKRRKKATDEAGN